MATQSILLTLTAARGYYRDLIARGDTMRLATEGVSPDQYPVLLPLVNGEPNPDYLAILNATPDWQETGFDSEMGAFYARPKPTLAAIEKASDALGNVLVELDAVDLEYKDALLTFEAKHAELIASRLALKETAKLLDADLRAEAVRFFIETADGNKKLTQGVTIESVTQAVYEYDALLEYAKLDAPFLLTLDPKVIKALALSLASQPALKSAFADMPLTAPKVPQAEISEAILKGQADIRRRIDTVIAPPRKAKSVKS